MIRDIELKQIQKYAQGLGIEFQWKPYVPRSRQSATWSLDGSTIEAFYEKRKSKTMLILDIVHELGHHHWWLANDRTIDAATDKAIGLENDRKPKEILDKEHRRLLYIMERDSADYHEYVYDQLQLKIPKYKLLAERDLSNWMYYRYYITGKFPTRKSGKRKRRELMNKYNV